MNIEQGIMNIKRLTQNKLVLRNLQRSKVYHGGIWSASKYERRIRERLIEALGCAAMQKFRFFSGRLALRGKSIFCRIQDQILQP